MSFERNITYQRRPDAEYSIPVIGADEMDIRKIPSELLQTVKYQRPILMEHVLEIVEDFNPHKVNLVKVSYRDGNYYVIDGAHTLAALKVLHKDQPFMVNCRVYHNLSFQEEAELFSSQYENKKKVPFQYELRGHLYAEQPEYKAFQTLTEKCGFKLAFGSEVGPCRIGALKKAWTIYSEMGSKVYERTLRTIMRTWGGVEWTLFAYMLGGIACFVNVYPGFSEKRFIQRLEHEDLDTIQRHVDDDAKNKDTAHAIAIAQLYNMQGGQNIVNVDLLKQ